MFGLKFGEATVTIALAGIACALLTFAAVMTAYRAGKKRSQQRAWRAALWTALLAGMASLLVLTLALPYATPGETGGVNLHPFQEINRYSGQLDTARGVMNLIGNIVVFMPVGALAAWLTRGGWLYRILAGTLLGAAFSVLIEIAQLSRGRVADIDDVILNTSGALLGAILAVIWRGMVHAFRRIKARHHRKRPRAVMAK